MYQKRYTKYDIIGVQRSENDMEEKNVPKIRFLLIAQGEISDESC